MSKNLEISYLLDYYGNVLTEKQRDIMSQYFNMDLSLSEIADNFDITRQGVRDAIKRGEHILLDLEEKVGFAKKYQSVVEGLEEIKILSQNIDYYNIKSHLTVQEIKNNSARIIEIANNLTD